MQDFNNQILCGDALEVLKTLPNQLVQSVITSPPYWALRDYGVDGQLGLEKDFKEYIDKLCNIFDEIKRVLKDDGVVFVNLGDTYNSHSTGKGNVGGNEGRRSNKIDNMAGNHKKVSLPDKSLCQIPSRFAIEMSNRGWILRNEIIWYKPSCLPASVKDRFTVDFEKIFFFTKKTNYLFNQQFEKVSQSTLKDTRPHGVLRQKMYNGKHVKAGMVKKHDVLPENDFREERNMRTVWAVNNIGIKDNHFAAYPEELVKRMLLASTNENDLILDPFFGAGTTGLTARKFNRNYLGIEINPKYIDLANKRLENGLGIFN